MTTQEFLSHLDDVRGGPSTWSARCPCPTHGNDGHDRNPSLIVWEKDGTPGFKCKTGCSKDEVLAAMGLTWRDLKLNGASDTPPPRAAQSPPPNGKRNGDPLRRFADYTAEESSARWRRRAGEMGIGDHLYVIACPFKKRATWEEWEGFADHLLKLVSEHRYGLVVLDALPNLWPVFKENEAGEVLRALAPLQACAEAGAAVLLVRHSRKSDGTEATAGRGSGAVGGFVDVIVEFRRYRPEDDKDTRRVLSVFSREEPFEAVVQWDGGAQYTAIGDKADATQSDRMNVVFELLSEQPGATIIEVLEAWPQDGVPRPGRRTLLDDLEHALSKGQVTRSGDGVRGSPRRWYLPGFDSGNHREEPARNESVPEKAHQMDILEAAPVVTPMAI